jgi:methionyl-tRNA formyltransferase
VAQSSGGGGFLKVLFWGTPLFSLPSFQELRAGGHEIVGVITQPDKPKGRGRKLAPSPVKEAALEAGIPVLTPAKPRGPEFLDQIRQLSPDISVVVAYGHILPTDVLDLPPRNSINVHASLLPELRGAGPVSWAILQGMEETGITIMRMAKGMDAGPILLQRPLAIGLRETASELTVRMAAEGGRALVEALSGLEAGTLEEREQDHAAATFAPKVNRELARIDWTRPARELGWHLRGFDAVPGAWTTLEGEPVKLFGPDPLEEAPHSSLPGAILQGSAEDGLVVACGVGALAGALRVHEAQPPGKRRMPVDAWLRGFSMEKDASFQ